MGKTAAMSAPTGMSKDDTAYDKSACTLSLSPCHHDNDPTQMSGNFGERCSGRSLPLTPELHPQHVPAQWRCEEPVDISTSSSSSTIPVRVSSFSNGDAVMSENNTTCGKKECNLSPSSWADNSAQRSAARGSGRSLPRTPEMAHKGHKGSKESLASCSSVPEWASSFSDCHSTGSRAADCVSAKEFRSQRQDLKKWFQQYNEVQRNLILSDLLDMCDLPQTHLLSLRLEQNLHKECPENCKDWISWLPANVTMHVFSFLDPVSLCSASEVCRSWNSICSTGQLWKSLCHNPKYMVSPSLLQKLIVRHTDYPVGTAVNGTSDRLAATAVTPWKMIFSEQYRILNNWMTGRCLIKAFDGHSGGVSCVQFDDTRIVSGSWDTTIKVWNIKTNLAWSAQTLTGHSNTVRCLHLNGNRLVSGSTDCTIKVWDLDGSTGWSSIACKVTMVGHTDAVRCLHVVGEKLVSGSYDSTLKIWNLNTGQCLNTLVGHSDRVLCVQMDDEKIISGSADKTIKIWSLGSDSSHCTNTLQGHTDAVTCLQFDTLRIVSGSLDCTIKYWDITTGRCVRSIDWMAAEGHTRVIRCIQADKWRLMSGSDDKTIKVWDLDTGRRLVTLRNHLDGVTCLQFSDTRIVSGSYDQKVLLWDFTI